MRLPFRYKGKLTKLLYFVTTSGRQRNNNEYWKLLDKKALGGLVLALPTQGVELAPELGLGAQATLRHAYLLGSLIRVSRVTRPLEGAGHIQ